MRINSLENVFEVFEGIDFEFAAGGAKGHEDRGGSTAGFAANKEPVFTTERDRSNSIFGQIVINRNPAVCRINIQARPYRAVQC